MKKQGKPFLNFKPRRFPDATPARFPAAVALLGVKSQRARVEGLLRNQHNKPAAKPAGARGW
ncbi:hypothetical protein M8494_03195 [Serratia ureilytica]